MLLRTHFIRLLLGILMPKLIFTSSPFRNHVRTDPLTPLLLPRLITRLNILDRDRC